MSDNIKLLLSDNRGVYIPQHFAQNFDVTKWGYTEDHTDIQTLLEGPDAEWYWEAWDNVLQNAELTDTSGKVWTLHQDGDLWAIAFDSMTNTERRNFGFDEKITHTYHINIDERGEFYADVRDESGKTVYEIHGFEIFEDGFMSDKDDTEGLQDYLINLGILPHDAKLE